MLQIAVGSTNPVKARAASNGFTIATRKEVRCHIFSVESSVPDQPVGEAETWLGAKTRAINSWDEYIKKLGKKPDFSIGFEGGVTSKTSMAMDCFAHICIYDGEHFGISKTASFPLPYAITRLVKEGLELGEADDKVFNTVNSKQGYGTVGKLTKGVINRTQYYEHAVVLAYARFNFPELYIE